MRDGIYEVQFRTPGDHGFGLLVVQDGKVNGGDSGFLYRGEIKSPTENNVAGRLRITQWSAGAVSVFGTGGDFHLDVVGTIDGHGAVAMKGTVPGTSQTLEGRARRIADVA